MNLSIQSQGKLFNDVELMQKRLTFLGWWVLAGKGWRGGFEATE